jgi:hypothetical protein
LSIKIGSGASFRKPYRIIWAHCGFKGSVSDITIARSQFSGWPEKIEKVGYIGEANFGVGHMGWNFNAEQV